MNVNVVLADSGGRRNALVVGEQLSECFGGGVVAEAFAGPAVEFGGDVLKLGGGVGAQVGAFGEVFAEQAVDVFVAAALPGRVGVGEVDLDAGGGGDALVLGGFGAAVPGEGLGEPGRQRAHVLDDGVGDGSGVVPGVQRQQGEVAGDALDDGADGRVGGFRPHDQVLRGGRAPAGPRPRRAAGRS